MWIERVYSLLKFTGSGAFTFHKGGGKAQMLRTGLLIGRCFDLLYDHMCDLFSHFVGGNLQGCHRGF